MDRFERIGNTYVRVDKIRRFWREGTCPETLIAELDDGRILREHAPKCGALEDCISGYWHIVQVIPCSRPLYIRYREENGGLYDYPVYYLGLCASGDIRPLEVWGAEGIAFADAASNYVGLFRKALEEGGKDNM